MTGSVEEDDREDEEVLLVPQDARWFSIYEHEAARLHTALSPHGLVGIEHVGSPQSPASKPIVDIVAGVGDLRDLPHYDDHFLLDLGYRWRGEQKDDWLYFVKRAPDGKRIAQLHVTPHDETFWKYHRISRCFAC
jgi:GrpB-like predicted nucleotidyltransferase (UPF0157 family)